MKHPKYPWRASPLEQASADHPTDAEMLASIDWKSALLEERGGRSPNQPKRQAPIVRPIARDPLEAWDEAPDAPAPAPARLPNWQAALREDFGLGAPSAARAVGAPAGTSLPSPTWSFFALGRHFGVEAIPGLTEADPQARHERIAIQGHRHRDDGAGDSVLAAHPPGGFPATVAVYEALQARALDAHREHLLKLLRQEPLFAYAQARWDPREAARTANIAIAEAVHLRIARLMGAVYDFDPAPLEYVPFIPRDTMGRYNIERNKIQISSLHLRMRFGELADTLAHEQTHAYQFAAVRRWLAGATVAPELASVLWAWAEHMAAGPRIPYDLRSFERHAFDVGGAVGAAMDGLASG